MIQIPFSILAIVTTILLAGNSHHATQQRATPKPPVLAVDVVDGRRRIPAPVFWPPAESEMEMGTTKPLADWKKTGDGPPLTRVKLQSVMESGAVRIKITAVFDDSEPADAPGPKYGRSEKPLGSYLAREGETLNVNELTRYGFEPLVLKIVKAVPHEEEPGTDFILPQVVNDLKAVEVVSYIPEPALTNSYHLTVRNVSTKNIVALDVYEPKESGRSGVTSLSGDPSRPVMTPGATHRLIVNETRGGYQTERGFVPEPSFHKFIVGTVVFDDETYEGETEEAVSIIATRAGNRVQLARAVILLQKSLAAADQNPTAMLEGLSSDVSGLRIDVDAQLVDGLISRFPELPKTYDRARLSQNVMRGLKDGRQSVVRQIKDVGDAARRDPASINTLWQRLNSLKEQLENEARPPRRAASAGG